MRVPWTARRSSQSILKEINPEYSLERLMLKLKLHNFGHLMQRANSLKKTLMLGKIEGKRRGQQMMRWLDGITVSMDMNLSKLQEIFPTQGSNPGLPHCRWILHQLSHKGSPRILVWVAYPFSRSSQPRNRTGVTCIASRVFTS